MLIDEVRKTMLRNLAGTTRSLAVLLKHADGEFDPELAQKLFMDAFDWMMNDEDHREKIRRALERYKLVDLER